MVGIQKAAVKSNLDVKTRFIFKKFLYGNEAEAIRNISVAIRSLKIKNGSFTKKNF